MVGAHQVAQILKVSHVVLQGALNAYLLVADKAMSVEADDAALGRAVADHLVRQVPVGGGTDGQGVGVAENARLAAVIDGLQTGALTHVGQVHHDTLPVHLANGLLPPVGEALVGLVKAAAAVEVGLHIGQLTDLQPQLRDNGPLVEILTHGGRVLQAEDHAQLAGASGRLDILHGLDLHDLVGVIFEEIIIAVHILQHALKAGLGGGEGDGLHVGPGLEHPLQIWHPLPLRRLGVDEVPAEAVNKKILVVQFLGSLFLRIGQCDRFHV